MTVSQRIAKGFFYLLLLPLTLGVCGWQGWLWWSWSSAPPVAEAAPAGADKTIKIEIPEGTSARQIGRDLEAVGLIRSATAWDLWTRWQSLVDRDSGFLAGTYELSPTESLDAIATKIWQGEVIEQSFTIPEGWSLQQMAEYFESEGLFTTEAFLKATQRIPRDRYPWLPASLPKLEGFLYPDTYLLTGEVTPEIVINQMIDRFEQVALPLHEQSQSPYTLLEWVTLASIVEKEAVVGEERPTIASVFARRLQEGIPLEADPTVEYAFGIRQTPEKPLTLAQVRQPSPYNTYVTQGLPPTPIASPGLASLEASLNPEETEYLYFVARYDGTHVFSRTLQEHEAAQAAIRDGLAAQPNSTNGAAN
jgi:UPF0755 protein